MIIKSIITILKSEKKDFSKNGRNWSAYRIEISSAHDPSIRLSGFFDERSPVLQWKSGEEHDIYIWQNGQYWNFRAPERIDILEATVKDLEVKRERMSVALKNLMAWAKGQGFDSSKTY